MISLSISLISDLLFQDFSYGYWLLAAGYWQLLQEESLSFYIKLPEARGQKLEELLLFTLAIFRSYASTRGAANEDRLIQFVGG
jgi:hypothetical protein